MTENTNQTPLDIMEKEYKDLLRRDLCSRLSYGVKCSFGVDNEIYTIEGINPNCCGASEIQATHLKSGINGDFKINSCKPYLFPLSSMTETQRIEYDYLYSIIFSCFEDGLCEALAKLQDWLDKNHFDYRGLIPKDLALDATGLNIY